MHIGPPTSAGTSELNRIVGRRKPLVVCIHVSYGPKSAKPCTRVPCHASQHTPTIRIVLTALLFIGLLRDEPAQRAIARDGEGPELRPAQRDRRRLNRVDHAVYYSRTRGVRKGGMARI